MGFWEFIVIVTAIGTVGGIIQSAMKLERHKIRAKALSGESEEQRALINEMHSEIVKLRDRVNVLERLATDEDRKLASEIERLRRDDRPNV